MTPSPANRFQDFFTDEKYVALKNHLYNYLLRKRSVEKVMRPEDKDLVLEIGSGISPVLTSWDRIIYSDLSPEAMAILQKIHGKGRCVVADALSLPFPDHSFSHVIASEVLEHLPDDQKALLEIARVLKPGGTLIVTFPHRRCYFAHDDRFVGHHRRYDIDDMIRRLHRAGFSPVLIRKVLGPLEKITMWVVTHAAVALEKAVKKSNSGGKRPPVPAFAVPLFKGINRCYAGLAWLDTCVMPRAVASVILIKAKKENPASDTH
jgi:SAM-dependent methyltransferase